MKSVNIEIPPTLRTLTTGELESLVIHTVNGRAGKPVLSEILSERFDTKRKVNSAVNHLAQDELIKFYCDVDAAKAKIDFGRGYFLLTEPHRSFFAIKQ
ncbi:hypothetical protein BIZ82_gp223 [Erwinia phage vB_EamM_EarlPhillipIV]|uniref:Uncharacterized protein n=1 Tax=Erwinia phage vB_EamM_EarlPhillipIV TaxID=1883372 RepID=A0A1B2ICX2_9CAUD|nr:hypothetical protein BIZ82_gp223 [Erwinia phage vB_EamM_EarlPhillipIV]ANZ49072.1 hypothetical protein EARLPHILLIPIV_223 [Erwinia phage vB_EamM_EarlPhillipIV]QXO09943.1 hypothetical protein pEaSNUABM38_00221 [Erwinia phage pEa_SNUABM_38]